MPLAPKGIPPIKSGRWDDVKHHVANVLTEVVTAINNVAKATGTDATGPAPMPTPIAKLSVLGGAGIFDVAITDNSSPSSAIQYVVQYSAANNFLAPHNIILNGPRNWRGTLGGLKLYWRVASQYPGGAMGPWVNSPLIDATGATAPIVQPGQGSGSS